MSRWVSSGWWRPALGVLAVLGLGLLAWGLKRALGWVTQGTIVAQAELPVPGAPPWSLGIDLPEAGRDYLVESTVAVEAPRERGATLSMRPEIRLFGPRGERLDQALLPAGPARTVLARGEARLTAHAWLRPFEPGGHQLQMVALGLGDEGLKPRRWTVRVAVNAPREPAGPLPAVAGFGLAVVALVLLVLTAKGRGVALILAPCRRRAYPLGRSRKCFSTRWPGSIRTPRTSDGW